MYDENDLIYSPLQQRLNENGRWVEIHIYRMPNSGWTLEVLDDKGASTVWDGEFRSDQEALAQALESINAVSIADFIDQPSSNSTH